MAHLEVERKPARPWWVWLLLVIVLIALAALLFKNCNTENKDGNPDSTGMDTSKTPLAKTVPDWNNVDFNAATTTDADITDTDIATRSNGTYTIYTLGENILFPTDGNDVSATGIQKLEMINAVLAKRFEGATIGVYGSTDATGPAAENKELGKQRAEAVKTWLSTSGSVPIENITVQSLGETTPVATNQTKTGRQQNRNVSIVVFPKQ
ncbi:OmpA family protein [Pedobacter frigiditerrae]|uniref:OmpA family protein n=1 Tax=Pedobacter frigiditerrae TaxID=2530452 RepID=A0A4R0MNJ6_9SPHI|nr:OmpA family protein [Pedobacter frigiditerrae]TCC88067.1 OmpA family protein [Pedobacter frigiditerrae]